MLSLKETNVIVFWQNSKQCIEAKENANQVNYKVQLEKGCREVQKNNDHIKSVNKKFTEEETKRREELLQNFENTIKEVTDKMEAQKKQADEFAAENET